MSNESNSSRSKPAFQPAISAARQSYITELEHQKAVNSKLSAETSRLVNVVQSLGSVHTNQSLQQVIDPTFKLASLIKECCQDVNAKYQRCFVDPECTHRIGAKIGLVGMEKAGKSTFLSGWCTNGATHQILPSTTAVCTGTTVQMFSSNASPSMSASVQYYSQDEYIHKIVPFALQLQKLDPTVVYPSEQCSNFTQAVQLIRTKQPFPSTGTISLIAIVNELTNYLQYHPSWQRYTSNPESNLPSVVQTKLLDKHLRCCRAFAHLCGRSEQISQTSNLTDLGHQLWRFISVVEESDSQTIHFTDNLLPLIVKVVSIVGPLPGLPDGIEINDLPGLDSEHSELNDLTSEMYKEMDILVFVKNPSHRSQLAPSEIKLLSEIQSKVDPDMSRVVVLVNCVNKDLMEAPGQAINSLVAAQHIHQRYIKDRSRIVLGFANRGEPNNFSPARVDEVVDRSIQYGFPIDPTDLNGYQKFTSELKGLVHSMPTRDLAQSRQVRAQSDFIRHSIGELLSVVSSFDFDNSGSDQSKVLRWFKGDRSTTGLFASILQTIDQVRSNRVPNTTVSCLPNNGTLLYFQPSLFNRHDEKKKKQTSSSLLGCSIDDASVFPNYCRCFESKDQLDNQEKLKDLLFEAIRSDSGQSGESTNQINEDNQYITHIRENLALFKNADTLGFQKQAKLAEWLQEMIGHTPLNFSMIEGHYRHLIRQECEEWIRWIATIDYANILSTLDHLIHAIMLTQTSFQSGCLLNIFVRPSVSGDQETTDRLRGNLKSFFTNIKEDIFRVLPRILQDEAATTLQLLTGVQNERLINSKGVNIPIELRDNISKAAQYMIELQRPSFVRLVRHPLGSRVHQQTDICQHHGWHSFDWQSHEKEVLVHQKQLVLKWRQTVTEVVSTIKKVIEDVNRVENLLIDAAPSIYSSLSNKQQQELQSKVPNFTADYTGANTRAFDLVVNVSFEPLPTDLSNEVFVYEVETNEKLVLQYQTQLDEATRLWEQTRAKFASIDQFINTQTQESWFAGKLVAISSFLKTGKSWIDQTNTVITHSNTYLMELTQKRAETQQAIQALKEYPGSVRTAYLKSLFCVPFHFTSEDLRQVDRSDTMIGQSNRQRTSVEDLLLLKQSRWFVERIDFKEYEDQTDNLFAMFENFPPPGGSERVVLVNAIHKRTAQALEHINELICYDIESESVLARSRSSVCDAFTQHLQAKFHELFGIVSDNKATIWPTEFASSEQMKQMMGIVKNLKEIAA